MDKHGQTWTNMDKHRQTWTNMDMVIRWTHPVAYWLVVTWTNFGPY